MEKKHTDVLPTKEVVPYFKRLKRRPKQHDGLHALRTTLHVVNIILHAFQNITHDLTLYNDTAKLGCSKLSLRYIFSDYN